MLQILRDKFKEAQNRMKQNAYKRRVDKEYKEGEIVYLKLQPYRQSTVAKRKNLKLTSQYYGPFKILKKNWPCSL